MEGWNNIEKKLGKKMSANKQIQVCSMWHLDFLYCAYLFSPFLCGVSPGTVDFAPRYENMQDRLIEDSEIVLRCEFVGQAWNKNLF